MDKLIVIAGPTAVGKTDISIMLAESINGEVISADSMQVYKYMDIGTAKIKPCEMKGIRHFLIDELLPDEEFNVMVFKERAVRYIKDIQSRGRIPVIVGGTGFYVQAVLYDIQFTEYDEAQSAEIKKKLEEEAATEGTAAMYERLKQADPVTAGIIHENDVKRVIRALEYYYVSGKRFSEHNAEQKQRSSPYDFKHFFIIDDRQTIYDKINRRVDVMIEAGLVEEVQKLLNMGYSRKLVSMQGLGYKEIAAYLEGECTLDEAVCMIKRDTRHFAKRQITWQRKEKNIDLIDRREYNDNQDIVRHMVNCITKI